MKIRSRFPITDSPVVLTLNRYRHEVVMQIGHRVTQRRGPKIRPHLNWLNWKQCRSTGTRCTIMKHLVILALMNWPKLLAIAN